MKRLCKTDEAHELESEFCAAFDLKHVPDPLEDHEKTEEFFCEAGRQSWGLPLLRARIDALDAFITRLSAIRDALIVAHDHLSEENK